MRLMYENRMRSLAVLVIGVLICGLTILFFRHQSSAPAVDNVGRPVVTAPQEFRYKPVSYLGDGYTVGVGAELRNGYSFQISRYYCWAGNNNGQSGTGYVNPGTGEGYSTYLQRVPDVVANSPEFIVVQGGAADVGLTGIRDAASATFEALLSAAPTVPIVVIGPFDSPSMDHAGVSQVRDEVRDAARENGLTFIDPIALNWSAEPSGYNPDGLIPKQSTHSQIAQNVTRQLDSLSVPALRTCDPIN